MAFNINDIRSELKYGGARPTMFQVTITNPIEPVADIKVPFLCEAASIPPSTIAPINVGYFGRFIKIPGDRTFDPWNVNVLNDEDFAIRDALEHWHNSINALEKNIAQNGSPPNNYKSQATVTQYGKDGQELRIYQLEGLWPSLIGPIELNWGDQNVIERFTVTWEYDTYQVVGGKTGDGGGN